MAGFSAWLAMAVSVAGTDEARELNDTSQVLGIMVLPILFGLIEKCIRISRGLERTG